MPDIVTVYYDYLCPYAWRGAELAEMVAAERDVQFRWHHFSIYQSRAVRNGQAQLWNARIDPQDETGGKGLLPFIASCAARRQGEDAYRAFRLGALRAYHRHCRPFTLGVLTEVARNAGLHMPRFESDLANPERRTVLANEHHQAVTLNIMGTPTFQFPNGQMACLQLSLVPARRDEAVALFESYRNLLETFPYVENMRRPKARSN